MMAGVLEALGVALCYVLAALLILGVIALVAAADLLRIQEERANEDRSIHAER